LGVGRKKGKEKGKRENKNPSERSRWALRRGERKRVGSWELGEKKGKRKGKGKIRTPANAVAGL